MAFFGAPTHAQNTRLRTTHFLRYPAQTKGSPVENANHFESLTLGALQSSIQHSSTTLKLSNKDWGPSRLLSKIFIYTDFSRSTQLGKMLEKLHTQIFVSLQNSQQQQQQRLTLAPPPHSLARTTHFFAFHSSL